jgi:AraC family transcriptional regulator, regulatory protein of adaptative response / methylated-DNA-[protein]-cysteine methyltransferase
VPSDTLGYVFLSTSVGRILLVVSKRGIRSLQMADGDDDARLLGAVRAEESIPLVEIPKLRREWCDRIEEVLAGEKRNTSIPLDLVGTPFRISAWKAICKIPHGQTRTYAEVAESIGAPRAMRAVGSACRKNRIGLIVPCHRVGRQGGDDGDDPCAALRRRLLDRERTADEALVS